MTRRVLAIGRVVVALLALGAPGCSGAPRPVETAQVRFLIEPDMARVYEDGTFVGAGRVLARRPAAFRPGPRHFTITADGYFPHDVEVELPEGLTTIRLRLRPVPP